MKALLQMLILRQILATPAAQQIPPPLVVKSQIGVRRTPHDAELGLIYMNGRYYVPSAVFLSALTRFVPNPANPQAWNRYSYVYNNPVTLSDPTGHIPCYMYCPQETYDPVQGQFIRPITLGRGMLISNVPMPPERKHFSEDGRNGRRYALGTSRLGNCRKRWPLNGMTVWGCCP
ncbi:MAG: hypothetical protein H6650_07385 [Ardenticatenales bacterium]|nr:hypothetical protein [Ardenticatenales bacterium]